MKTRLTPLTIATALAAASPLCLADNKRDDARDTRAVSGVQGDLSI